MARTLFALLFAFGVLAGGCAAGEDADKTGAVNGAGSGGDPGTGGAGGLGRGSSGGSGGDMGGVGRGGTGGALAGGSGGASSPDAATINAGGAGGTEPDAVIAAASDAPVSSGGSPDGAFMGVVPDGAPWQMMCPETASRSDCCSLYCSCMMKNCPATIPMDCQAACVSAKNWDLVCRTYQCFASRNPNYPQDHDSHCRHAIGLQGKCGNR